MFSCKKCAKLELPTESATVWVYLSHLPIWLSFLLMETLFSSLPYLFHLFKAYHRVMVMNTFFKTTNWNYLHMAQENLQTDEHCFFIFSLLQILLNGHCGRFVMTHLIVALYENEHCLFLCQLFPLSDFCQYLHNYWHASLPHLQCTAT